MFISQFGFKVVPLAVKYNTKLQWFPLCVLNITVTIINKAWFYTYRLFMGLTLTATRTDAIAHPSY